MVLDGFLVRENSMGSWYFTWENSMVFFVFYLGKFDGFFCILPGKIRWVFGCFWYFTWENAGVCGFYLGTLACVCMFDLGEGVFAIFTWEAVSKETI